MELYGASKNFSFALKLRCRVRGNSVLYIIICSENQDCKKICTFFWEIFCSSLVAERHVIWRFCCKVF